MHSRWFRRTTCVSIHNRLSARLFSTIATEAKDTIYALSTAQGRAGIAVIRVSGPCAKQSLSRLTNISQKIVPRRAELCKVYEPITKKHLDDAIVLYFPKPNSFTGEDVVEYHVHGGPAVVQGMLKALEQNSNHRIAEAGEFTERAFNNQKLDLIQVEALSDLLSAETESQRDQALQQLSGEIGEVYESWRKDIIACLAYVEAMIDFGDDEDDVTDASYQRAILRVQNLLTDMKKFVDDGRRGEILRSGMHVAIVGPPNAGKSSLLNVLARRSAAIVSSDAGTTRDVVQVPLNLRGYPVLVSDTAGLRDAIDPVEKDGVSRARQCANEADICLFLIDSKSSLDLDKSLIDLMKASTLIVLNKSDLIPSRENLDAVHAQVSERHSIRLDNLLSISCTEKRGIEQLVARLGKCVEEKLQGSHSEWSIITRERHRQHIQSCINDLNRFLECTHEAEFAAEHLRNALGSIGRILGRVDVEQVLDVLFSDFCIGK